MDLTKSILYAICACLLWSQVFILPLIFEDIPAIWLMIGRCIVYSSLSTLIILTQFQRIRKLLNWPLIKQLLILAFVANILHYFALIVGLRYADPAIATMILSLNPVTVSLYSNLQEKLVSMRTLFLPILTIGIGLLFLYIPSVSTQYTQYELLMASIFGLIALGTWTWFIIYNNLFFKRHFNITPQDWVTLLGFATGFWVVAATIIFYLFKDNFSFIYNEEIRFSLGSWFLASVILGVGSSWIAHYLWVAATKKLPMTLAGLLTTLEGLFGLVLIFVWQASIPSPMYLTGMFSIFSGVCLSIYFLHRQHLSQMEAN